MQDDTEVVDGDDYFEAAVNGDSITLEPEANGDATPIGDVDSEADPVVGDEADADTDEDAAETGESVAESDDDAEPDAEADEWLPGFEGRFRPGEEAKALEAYRNLESEYSRRQNEFRDQLAAEREAAFEQAAKLLQQQQSQPSVMQQLQERQQLTQLAHVDPGNAFRAALQSGDEATIDAVIQAVATGDPEMGIDGDYGSALQMQAAVQQLQQQQREQQVQQEIQQLKAQAVIAPTAESFKNKYAELLTNQDVASAFQQTLTNNWNELTALDDADAVNKVLERSLQQAIGHVALAQGIPAPSQAAPTGEPQQPQAARPAKRRPHTESGQHARIDTEPKKSQSDEYADELLAAARHLKPAY